MNDNRDAAEAPGSLTELMSLVAKCRQTYGQTRVFMRELAFMMGKRLWIHVVVAIETLIHLHHHKVGALGLLVAICAALCLTGHGALSLFASDDEPTTDDVTPPSVTELKFEPSFIDTSDADQMVTLVLQIQDDFSGFGGDPADSWLRIRSPYANVAGWIEATITAADRVSGTAWNGTYHVDFVFPQRSYEGVWSLQYLQVSDEAGNIREVVHYLGFGLPGRTCEWPERYPVPYFVNVETDCHYLFMPMARQ